METSACRDFRGAAVVRMARRCMCSAVHACSPPVHVRMRRATSRIDAASARPCVATRSRASMQADAPRAGHAMPDLRDPVSGWTPRRRGPSLIHSARATGIRARLRKKRHLNTGRGPGPGGFMRPRNARSAFQSRPDWVRVPAFAREAGCGADVLPRRLPGDGAGPRPPSTRSFKSCPELSLCPGLAGALFFARTVPGRASRCCDAAEMAFRQYATPAIGETADTLSRPCPHFLDGLFARARRGMPAIDLSCPFRLRSGRPWRRFRARNGLRTKHGDPSHLPDTRRPTDGAVGVLRIDRRDPAGALHRGQEATDGGAHACP
jgi:hypothetical protein